VVAALPTSPLLRWRYDARELQVIAITATGTLVIDVCCDDGREYLGDEAGDLADELETEMRLFAMRDAACPVRPAKYDASIPLPPCGAPRLSLAGQTFGRLTAMKDVGADPKCRNRLWECRCECGLSIVTRAKDLKAGKVASCGCSRGVKQTTHGHSKRIGKRHHVTGTYQSWVNMIQRCTNPNGNDYPYYGGRGITVCARWLESFENFLEDMGERPAGLTIDRVDNNLLVDSYSKANCRWATRREQNLNTRRSKKNRSIHAV
jgi:hypothetical protein